DWSRRTIAVQTEIETQTEALSNVTGHNRSISEVTDSVAKESQKGFSQTRSTSSSNQSGAGGGILTGLFGIGESNAQAGSETWAYSTATSSGERDVSSALS